MIIAVTGSFGSGKSSVAKIMKKFSKSEIVDADRIADKIFQKNKEKIKHEFGTLDKKKIAEIVFSDEKKLRKLNSIIHPAVIKEIKKNVQKKKDLILDVPLLIETELHRTANIVIVVRAPEKEKIKRLGEKGFTKKQIKNRVNHQLSDREKIKHADYVIKNNKNLEHLEKEVEKIWQMIK